MDCPLRSGHDLADAYVAGTLPEAEQDAYEQHFFSCSACLAQVQTLQELGRPPAAAAGRRGRAPHAGTGLDVGPVARPGARGRPGRGVRLVVAGRREPAPGARRSRRPPARRRRPAPNPNPTANPSGPTVPPLPPEHPVVDRPRRGAQPPRRPRPARADRAAPLRAPRGARRGAAGRQLRRGHGALRGRPPSRSGGGPGRAVAGHADRSGHRVLLGHQRAGGRPSGRRPGGLSRAIAADVQPYADEAHFYLAKAYLAEDAVDQARRELRYAVEHEAGPEGEAQRLLAELDRLPR